MDKLELDLIVTRNGYGFGHDWQLSAKKGEQRKIFYLGQDAKVAARVLGMNGREIAQEIGCDHPIDMDILETRQAIARLILEAYNIHEDNEDQLFDTPPWELAAE